MHQFLIVRAMAKRIDLREGTATVDKFSEPRNHRPETVLRKPQNYVVRAEIPTQKMPESRKTQDFGGSM